MQLIPDLEPTIFTVSQLNSAVKTLLESHFAQLWVEGEISNLRAPGSGHLYFSLKDSRAQVRCALFRLRGGALKFQPKDGAHVLLRGRISLYEERGDFQLIVEYMEETGEGLLRQAFELLKKRLEQQGLFALTCKKLLPKMPRCIGVITSPTGAAIRDILSVLKRRFPGIPIIIYPTQVQGGEAAPQIVRALAWANQRQECEVLILARGGGSLEDLWPFNEEVVAHAIFHSTIPLISGIGHEIDFTIADLVADQRAATPSAAAELASPDGAEWAITVARAHLQLLQAMRVALKHSQLLLQNLTKRLTHPKKRLEENAQRIDGYEQRLRLAFSHIIRHQQARLNQLSAQLHYFNPLQQTQLTKRQILVLQQRLQMTIQHSLAQKQEKLTLLMRALDGVSPLNTLKRGYAIITKEGKILYDAQQVQQGDKVQARLSKGTIKCIIN